jgi:hypothetical protein
MLSRPASARLRRHPETISTDASVRDPDGRGRLAFIG